MPGAATGETGGTGEARGTDDGRRPPAELLEAVPRIADQSGGVRERLDRLGELVAWPAFLSSAAVPTSGEEIRASLSDVVDVAVLRYLWFGHGNG
ncbi:MAG: hypothetical protein ACRD0B_10615, partial [Acidimicrobiales bacterium]